MGWLIALFVVVGIGLLPLGVQCRYNAAGLLVKLIAGPVRITLYPSKREKKNKPQSTGGSADSFEMTKKQTGKTGGSVAELLQLMDIALAFLNDLRKKLRVDRLELKLILGGGDPCNLSINYGRAWAVLGNLMPLLSNVFVIKKRDLEVECDYTATETTILARIDLTITVARLLSLAVCYGIRALRKYLNIINKRKGGAIS